MPEEVGMVPETCGKLSQVCHRVDGAESANQTAFGTVVTHDFSLWDLDELRDTINIKPHTYQTTNCHRRYERHER